MKPEELTPHRHSSSSLIPTPRLNLPFPQVSDPVQHTEGIQKYTTYRVDVRPPATTPADMPQDVILAGSAYSAVLRRYSDFLWLFERLQLERAGSIVPPLPEKQPVGRFSPEFVQERRMQLERFLRRLAVHPELADATALDTFLRADDVSFAAAKNSKKTPPPLQASMLMSQSMMMPNTPPKKEGFKRWFAETKTSMTGDLVKSPDDDIFEEITRYVSQLDAQMKNISQQATGLVRKGKEVGNGLFEFGLAFKLLGQSEGDSLGEALGQMGTSSDNLSALSLEHAEKEIRQFEEPLQDYIKMIHSVKVALHRRHEKRLSYSTCLSEVDAKQQSLNKLRSQLGNEAKAYQMEGYLREAHNACNLAREDFMIVSQRVLREVDRFKGEKADEMRNTVHNYILLQISYNRRMEELWTRLIPQLENIEVPDAPVLPLPPQIQTRMPQTSGSNMSVVSHQLGRQPGAAVAQGIVPSMPMSSHQSVASSQPMQTGMMTSSVQPVLSQGVVQNMVPQSFQPQPGLMAQQTPLIQQSQSIPQYNLPLQQPDGLNVQHRDS